MMKYYQNEELCKKPEVSIFENMAMILEKPVFRGWYPLIYVLGEKIVEVLPPPTKCQFCTIPFTFIAAGKDRKLKIALRAQ